MAVEGSSRSSRSSSTVGRKLDELKTEELHVVVEADDNLKGSEAATPNESDIVRTGTVLLLELLNPPLSSSIPESSCKSLCGRLPEMELAAEM